MIRKMEMLVERSADGQVRVTGDFDGAVRAAMEEMRFNRCYWAFCGRRIARFTQSTDPQNPFHPRAVLLCKSKLCRKLASVVLVPGDQ